ncbi:uncharacterized protein LOC131252933 [Magnolia sinica]|uniref:uncharacterized protein LOC131252933 n=1 Tax=Magnolia sinica TaxID=86752 RepID=UPI00265911EB|nr:uncharacterized protein LOC131252933 [Magnolia sinica]
MKSLSSLGIGLSLVFGCLFLALVAELYYLLWWKKRISNRDIEDDYSSSTRELFYLLCWKKPTSSSTALNPHTSARITDGHGHHGHPSDDHSNTSGMDLLLKPYGEDGLDTELMRLHNQHGPPRFLFTIKEETKEDLESDDGKSKGDNKSRKGSRGKSLSDLLLAVETPFLTPLSSPPFFTPPLTPMDCYNQTGFNPLFESSTDAEVSRMRSPPPKFKFLKDAEEKLYRKTLMERALKAHRSGGPVEDEGVKGPTSSKEEDGSFITILIGKSKEKDHLHHSSSSQVLPLPSSPSNIRPVSKKPMIVQ